MAFTRATGKHRRAHRAVRSGANLAGIAALATTGVAASIAASPAMGASAPAAQQTGLRQAIVVGDSLAESVTAQARAQHTAAERAAAKARAEAAAKKRAEEARAAKARAKKRAAREAERKRLHTFVPPVTGSYISTGYKASGGTWSSGSHTGIDFHAAAGTPVHAVGAGTVVEADWGGSYGNNIVIKMHDGTYTHYGHLSSFAVSVGQSVTPGERIALSGSTGNTTGPHLHFEARTTPDYGSDVDPIAYLRARGVRV